MTFQKTNFFERGARYNEESFDTFLLKKIKFGNPISEYAFWYRLDLGCTCNKILNIWKKLDLRSAMRTRLDKVHFLKD